MVMEKYFKDMEAAQAPSVLPRDHWWIIRVDGRAFHTWTRLQAFARPYDAGFMASMDRAAITLCEEIQNARYAFVQSDEISVIVHAEGEKAQTWFGGERDKVISISAAIASSCLALMHPGGLPQFDSRVVTTPDAMDVERYLIWRQHDAFRNAVQMAAQHHFSHKQLEGRNLGEKLDKLYCKTGLTLEALLPEGFRKGRLVAPHTVRESVTFQHKKTGEWMTAEDVERRSWHAAAAPWFEDVQVL